jgi:gag-polypeptide of LTR copia-type/Zinc knuckle
MMLYIREMDCLVDRLRGIGVKIDEEERGVHLLGNLSQEYSNLRLQLLNQDNLNYNQICEKLLSTAALLESERGSKSMAQGPSVHVVKKGGGRPGRGSKGNYFRGGGARGGSSGGRHCYVCGDFGHLSYDCTKKGGRTSKKVVCYNCKEE